jgi:hypothetical protein
MISTRVHGVLDYASVAGLLALPRLRGWHGGANQALTANAAGSFLYSILTRYELGLLRLLPMPAHLSLDAAAGAMLCVAGIQTDADNSVRATLIAIGLFEITVAFLTDTEVPITDLQAAQPQDR